MTFRTYMRRLGTLTTNVGHVYELRKTGKAHTRYAWFMVGTNMRHSPLKIHANEITMYVMQYRLYCYVNDLSDRVKDIDRWWIYVI